LPLPAHAALIYEEQICLRLYSQGNRFSFPVVQLALQSTRYNVVLDRLGDDPFQRLDFSRTRQPWIMAGDLLVDGLGNDHLRLELLEDLQVPDHCQADER